MTTAVLVLIEAPVPAFDDAPAGMAVPARADPLAVAVVSAMTLFGRCEVRRFVAAPQFSNGRWIEGVR